MTSEKEVSIRVYILAIVPQLGKCLNVFGKIKVTVLHTKNPSEMPSILDIYPVVASFDIKN